MCGSGSASPSDSPGCTAAGPPRKGSVCTSTIITTGANDLVKPVHDRMPVIMPHGAYDLWLDPAVQDPERLLAVLKPFPAGELVLYDVSPRVNSLSNNSPENIVPLSLVSGSLCGGFCSFTPLEIAADSVGG